MKNRLNRLLRLAFAAALVVALALSGWAQYREYSISGKVVDSQKNALNGVSFVMRDTYTIRSL
jgi:hypothetical protein